MNTLANILAGVPANPYQNSGGISPMLLQQGLAQNMGQALLAQGGPSAATGQQQSGMNPLAGTNIPLPNGGFGSLGALAYPAAAGLY